MNYLLIKFPNPILKKASEKVQAFSTDELRALVRDMTETMYSNRGIGLAANQIGVGMRAFSYNIDDEVGYIINPVIAELAGEPELVDEGCLSVPGFYFPRMRHPQALVTGVDLDGNAVKLSGTGLMAQALQHEVDHLDGHLYIEGLSSEVKREAMRLIRLAPWY